MFFKSGQEIDILQYNEVIDTAVVLETDKEHEIIRVKSLKLNPGEQVQFGFFRKLGGWKVLFEGLGGELCYNSRTNMYVLKEGND